MLQKEFQNIVYGTNPSVAAAGSAQGDAAAVTDRVTTVTGADGTKGVILPAGDGDMAVFVLYSSAATNACKVYPPTGAAINAGSANAAFSMTAQKPTVFVRVSSTVWLAVLSA